MIESRTTGDDSRSISGLRIAVVVPNLGGGGAEFVALEWSKWLISRGHDVTVIITHPSPTDLLPPGVEVMRLRAGNLLSHAFQLRSILKRERIDLSVALMPYFNILVLLAGLFRGDGGPKTIISGRNVEMPLRRVHGLSFRVQQALARVLYSRADAYVAISHPVAAEAAALYPIDQSRIFVVPNPSLAKTAFGRGTDPAGLVADGARLDSKREICIVVPARLVRQKRPDMPIRVAKLIERQVEGGISVHYFGTGPLQAEIHELALAQGVSVVFHGWVDKWFETCPANSVVLLPSLAEGFGNVLLEAAAVGIPSVVSSKCLGSADAVIPGVTGILCAGDEAEDYAAAMTEALSMDMHAPDSWLTRFTPESSGATLERVIQSVFRSSPKR